MKSIRIQRDRRLRDDPGTGHNRWHPDISPLLEVAPGETFVLETRDASDGQIRDGMRFEDLAKHDKKAGHPLTGPVFVQGAEPGDLLEVEFVEIEPQPYGWTVIRPGAGLLREDFHEGFLAHWRVDGGFARSPQVPGVRIPEGVFMGTVGVAPSRERMLQWAAREAALAARGGIAMPPDAQDAVPGVSPMAQEGLRTIPPRENGGNLDIRQLTRGARLELPVFVPGALFSAGDAHYAQGDSECCITAIEMGATLTARLHLHKGEAARRRTRFPRFSHPGWFAPPQWAAPHDFIATMGFPIEADDTQQGEDLTLAAKNALREMILLLGERGFSPHQAYVICSLAVDLRISNATMGFPIEADDTQQGEDLTLAAKNALREMILLLGERGFSPHQAYVICSLAVDLRISNAVDLPNVGVSALLPRAIFESF